MAGPLSDVHGRRRPLVAGMAAFTAASLLCAVAPNIYALAAIRLVQGILAATGIVIARAVVRDLYTGNAAARYLSRLYVIIGLAPILVSHLHEPPHYLLMPLLEGGTLRRAVRFFE